MRTQGGEWRTSHVLGGAPLLGLVGGAGVKEMACCWGQHAMGLCAFDARARAP